MFVYFDAWPARGETVLRDYLMHALPFTRRRMRHREAISLAQGHTAEHILICVLDTRLAE